MTYNFATDIEERNPWTGSVYYISRMTSDWAERHPLNVGDVIDGVYREFEGTEFEESREELWRVWTAVLAVSSPQGDASLYPNRGGRRRAAAMKVWLLAGDYWRRGFRTGDVLPAMVPGCRITRIGGDGRAIERYSLADRPGTAWIALFPKEMHLLEAAPAEVADAPTLEGHTDSTDSTDSFTHTETTETTEKASAVADDFSPEVLADGKRQSRARGSQRGSEQAQMDAAVIAPIGDQSAEQEPSFRPPLTPPNSGGEAAAEVDPSSIDPRDEEIAALRARIAELEAQASPVIESVGNQATETPSPCQASDTEGTGTSVPSADAGTARMEPVHPVSPAAAEVEPSPVTDGIGNQSIDIVVVSPRPTERERNAAARQRRREQREAQRHSYEARLAQEAAEAEAYARQQERRKIFAAIGAAAVTLALIYFFGLLGPAVFGLLAGGLLKG